MCMASAAAVAPLKLMCGKSEKPVFLQVKNGFLDFFTEEDKNVKKSACARSLSVNSAMSRGKHSVSTAASTGSERSSSPSGRSAHELDNISVGSAHTSSTPRCRTQPTYRTAPADVVEDFQWTPQAYPQQCGPYGVAVSLACATGAAEQEPEESEELQEQQPTRGKKDLTKFRTQETVYITTIMLRGIPCSLSQERVMEILDMAGFAGMYDFFYLPRAGKSTSNLGYAFVNFVHPTCAAACQASMQGVALDPVRSQKTCTITTADIQGLENLKKHFRRTAVGRSFRGPVYLKTQAFAA